MQLVSSVNLTVVEASEHLCVSGSVATPKRAASPFPLERSRMPGLSYIAAQIPSQDKV